MSETKAKVLTDDGAIDVLEWCRDLVHGCGGFHDYERYELAVFEDRDVSLVYFALRSLVNPHNEPDLLPSLIRRRDELAANQRA